MSSSTVLPRFASEYRTASRNKPNFFIVGAPKCGTTAMAQYLAEHPDIFMAKKEMHFFGEDLSFGRRFYRRTQAEYLNEYETCTGQSQMGESSVWYLFSRRAAVELREFNPQSRIIIMLREPVEMMYSLYHQFLFDGNENLPTFAAALAAEPERSVGRHLGHRNYFAQGLGYRDCARYTEQVQRYFDTFGRDRVQVITYDDFAADPAATYGRTLDFLGVDRKSSPRQFHVVNGNKTIRSRTLWVLLSDPCLRAMVLAMRPWLPRTIVRLLYRTEARLWAFNTQFVKRPPLAPDLRAQLKLEFKPEVERLSNLLGRDLSHWSL